MLFRSKHTQAKHLREFDHTLELNDYPPEIIQKARTEKQRYEGEKSSDVVHFRFPYISDEIDRKVKRIFREENINVRLTRKGYTIRQYLNKTNKRNPCTLTGCILKDPNICSRKNVIYQITCNTCNSTYIGSTIRHLHIRVREHLSNKSSSVYKHLRSCGNNGNNISVQVLSSDHDCCNIRIREAIFIKKFKPKINNKEEQDAFSDFLYVCD